MRLAPFSSCTWLKLETVRVTTLPVPLLVPASHGSEPSVTGRPSGRMRSLAKNARKTSRPAAAVALCPDVLDGCEGVAASGCQAAKPLLTAPDASALSAVMGRQNFWSYFDDHTAMRASTTALATSANSAAFSSRRKLR